MTRSGYSTVVLPGGHFDSGGVRHCEVTLRAMTGRDEEWAATVSPREPQAGFVTGLLARVVRSIGPYRATRHMAREMTPGDRDYLLLKLYEITYGGHVELTLTCSDRECAARMHASFETEQIPVEPGEPAMSRRLAGTETVFRLPRGADQEEIAAAGLKDQAAVRRLLEQCVLAGPPASQEAWLALANEIERVSPRVDFELETVCPECGRASVRNIDPALWFIGEISRRQTSFEREIHLLGLHYHWPLSELLELSCARRNRWTRLLTRELDRQPEASYL